jgi:hypothetical protein
MGRYVTTFQFFALKAGPLVAKNQSGPAGLGFEEFRQFPGADGV